MNLTKVVSAYHESCIGGFVVSLNISQKLDTIFSTD
jgi:hypothetical protein